MLELFKSKGADLNERDSFNQSPLFYACRDGQVECIKKMICFNADVNQRDQVRQTALFYAAREGNTEVVQALLDYGADVNLYDNKRQTALFFAKKRGHSETVRILIDKGAINTKDGRLKQSDISKMQKQIKTPTMPSITYSGKADNSVTSKGQVSGHNSFSINKKVYILVIVFRFNV